MSLVCIWILLLSSVSCHVFGRERVEDAWQAGHYKDGEHHDHFDHEAVLGSKDAAKEFDQLSPEESRSRLRLLANQMDANTDGFVDKSELSNWVMNSFKTLALEDGEERLAEEDIDHDGYVSWEEHLRDSFDLDDDTEEEQALRDEVMAEDKALFVAADGDSDGRLNKEEFAAFNTPEDFEHLHETLYNQVMKKRDKDGDGHLNLDEFLADHRGHVPESFTEQYKSERDKFVNDYDADGDGRLDRNEVLKWIIPDNREMADDEANHLIDASDDNGDGKLSIDEIVNHHETFVGSEATDFGQQLDKIRPIDEL